MKNATKSIVLSVFILSTFLPLKAITPDIRLEKEITPTYVLYLAQKEAEYLLTVNLPLAGDNTETMKAHMGLAVLQAAWTHINGDTLVNDVEKYLDEIAVNSENIVFQTYDDILPLFGAKNPNDFVLNLTEFFENGTYPAYRDSIDAWLKNIGNGFDGIGTSMDWFGEKTDPIAEMFGDHWDAVANGTADFEYAIQLGGTEYEDTLFIFSRKFFNSLECIKQLGSNTATALDTGFTQILDSLNNNSTDIEPGVAVVHTGLDSLYNLLDSIQIFLWSQPFAPFELDLAGIDSLQELVVEFDTLLAGKEYPFGPEEENKTIRPRGIIESLGYSGGFEEVYQNFYRQGESATFTFQNTFPKGITNNMYAMIASDIILNANDSKIAFEAKLHAYQAVLLLKEASPFTSCTPDEHFGIALTLLYDLLNDKEYFSSIEDALNFISEGHIDSLFYYYDWSSFDVQDKIDEIRYHVDQYTQSDEVVNYVVLIKENSDGLENYTIGENSEFSVFHLTTVHVEMVTKSIDMFCYALSKIADAIDGIYAELSNILDLNLDPSVLDFSDVESDMDVILILEQSNPNFLSVTPYGVEKFHEAGDWLEDAFMNLGTFYDNMSGLMAAMKPYETDFDMNASSLQENMDIMSEISWTMYEDFAFPDSTMQILGERVNLSAWFDNPPTSFLQMWKNFVFGVDSTLGGLFPDRYRQTGTYELPVLPKQFKLYPVYPNPFNPVATIEFDLPSAADIKLTIIDLKGATVAELINGSYKAGKIIHQWNASVYPSGIYFCRLSIDGKISTQKMTLMK